MLNKTEPNMHKGFSVIYEDPEYLEEQQAMAEMPQDPPPDDEELERMAYFYQQRAKEREHA